MTTAVWYFDLVSPFSYLQLASLSRPPAEIEIEPRPVLLAALLKHWGQLGPAEIPAKRLHTYRLCQWQATRRGLRFSMPPVHPFNPLRTLRLLIALGAELNAVRIAFDLVYAEGRDPNNPSTWAQLEERLGTDNADALADSSAAKEGLRHNTEAAIAAGVFGVPTFRLRGEIFWGNDALDMMLDFYRDPGLFGREEMARLTQIPVGAKRAWNTGGSA